MITPTPLPSKLREQAIDEALDAQRQQFANLPEATLRAHLKLQLSEALSSAHRMAAAMRRTQVGDRSDQQEIEARERKIDHLPREAQERIREVDAKLRAISSRTLAEVSASAEDFQRKTMLQFFTQCGVTESTAARIVDEHIL